jgi:hypothetical protein
MEPIANNQIVHHFNPYLPVFLFKICDPWKVAFGLNQNQNSFELEFNF